MSLFTRTIILVFSIILICCQQQTNKTPEIKTVTEIKSKKREYPKVDTNNVVDGNYFYQFVPATDSTSFIKWGSNGLINISKTDLYNDYLEKEKLYVRWANKKFIVLGRGTGSDAWIDIVLPLIKGYDLRFYYNSIAFDKENGIIVCEWYVSTALVS